VREKKEEKLIVKKRTEAVLVTEECELEQKKCLYLLEQEKRDENVTGYDATSHIYLNQFYVCIWLWQPQNIRKLRWEVENIVVVLYVDCGIHPAKYNQNITRDRCLFPI